MKIKTFKDLTFKKREGWLGHDLYQAVLSFPNGYGVSVLLGEDVYSNGKDTYEVGITLGDSLCYDTFIADDVLGYLTEEEIDKVMESVQSLPDTGINNTFNPE